MRPMLHAGQRARAIGRIGNESGITVTTTAIPAIVTTKAAMNVTMAGIEIWNAVMKAIVMRIPPDLPARIATAIVLTRLATVRIELVHRLLKQAMKPRQHLKPLRNQLPSRKNKAVPSRLRPNNLLHKPLPKKRT